MSTFSDTNWNFDPTVYNVVSHHKFFLPRSETSHVNEDENIDAKKIKHKSHNLKSSYKAAKDVLELALQVTMKDSTDIGNSSREKSVRSLYPGPKPDLWRSQAFFLLTACPVAAIDNLLAQESWRGVYLLPPRYRRLETLERHRPEILDLPYPLRNEFLQMANQEIAEFRDISGLTHAF